MPGDGGFFDAEVIELTGNIRGNVIHGVQGIHGGGFAKPTQVGKDQIERTYEEGSPLRLKMGYGPNTSQTLELISVAVQDDLRDVGVEVEIQALEWSSCLETIHAQEPDWDIYIGAWRAPIERHIMYTIWADSSIPQLNAVGYVNQQVEEIFQEAGKSYDPIAFRAFLVEWSPR